MFTVFPQPVLIMLIRALKGNPYLVNWFNPSISLVHGLVSVTDKCNMISEASPRLLLADAEGTAARSRNGGKSRPGCQVRLSPWRFVSHLRGFDDAWSWNMPKRRESCYLAWTLQQNQAKVAEKGASDDMELLMGRRV